MCIYGSWEALIHKNINLFNGDAGALELSSHEAFWIQIFKLGFNMEKEFDYLIVNNFNFFMSKITMDRDNTK